MSETVYFLKRGEKIVGPYNLAAIRKLSESQKIRPTDFVSQWKDGPWRQFSELEEKLFGSVSAVQDIEIEVEEAMSSSESQTIPDPNLITCLQCSASVPKDAETCPSCGFAFVETEVAEAGLPAFDYGLPPSYVPLSVPQATAYQPSPYHTPSPKKTGRTRRDEDEDLRSGDGWILFPWRAGNGGIRYWSLKKYLAISEFLASLTFGLLAYIPIVLFLLGSVAQTILFVRTDTEPAMSVSAMLAALTLGWMAAFLGCVIWFIFCHLLFISMMAFVDLLRCIIDIERNTR